jgi:hypothetical protein
MSKMKPDTWDDLPFNVRAAYQMYPLQAPEWAQRVMQQLANRDVKKSPMQGVIDAQQAQREQARIKRR